MYKVLIVDDNPNNLYTLRSLLAKLEECEIIEAQSGYEVLSIVLKEDIRLIILDIQMPEMDGFEVAELLKGKESTKNIPIIFLTAVFKSDDFQEHGYEIGAIDYLTKPINDNILLNKVKLYLTLFSREDNLAKTIIELKDVEAEVFQAAKMASIGEMIGAIAHQWRQPLNVIGILVQDIKQMYEYNELNQERLQETVDKVMKSLKYMSQTIDDFRNFMKPSIGKALFTPCQVIEEIAKILEVYFEKNNVVITVTEHEHFEIEGYPNDFKQVILNIFNNSRDAIKASGVEKGTIVVHILRTEGLGTFCIRDNGGGIASHLLPDKIFDSYTSTKGDKGTGIGMNISKQIIEKKFNGKISAKNVEGGAEICIEIPLVANAVSNL